MTTAKSAWHAAESDLRAYTDGVAPPVVAASLDAHLIRCAHCRQALAHVAEVTDTERRWDRLADAIDRPTPSLAQRLGVVGDSGGSLTMKALAAPSMRWAWLTALVAVVGLPMLAGLTLDTGSGALALLLALAPLVPVGAVAVAYRDVADPAGEITLATPSAGLRLVAARALVVSAVAVPAGIGIGWLVGVPVHLAVAGLLPGLALAALVLLAGTTRLDPVVVAGALAGLWALTVGTPSPLRDVAVTRIAEALGHPSVQLTALVVTIAALLLTLARRDAVAYRRTA